MLLRVIYSGLALLSITFVITITWLTTWVTPTQARPALLPVTPPPAPISAPFNNSSANQTNSEATSEAITTTQIVTTSTPLSPATANQTSDDTSLLLPTVTPQPDEFILLPTATPTLEATAATTLLMPTPTSTRPAISTATILATEGETEGEMENASIDNESLATPIATAPALTGTLDLVPSSAFVTVTVPLPASYRAQGSFASQTVYTDSTIVQQQGSFNIVQAAALNAYASNQRYTLSTQRAVGLVDEINVYQIDDYIAVNYTGGNWMLVRRDQGSNIVRAIQPITDLAVLFPRTLDQAEFVGQEEIAGISTLRYRIDDPTGQGARLIQPLLALTGDIRSLKLEVWLAVPGGYVVAYNFQVELAGARVLNAEGDEVRADQAVTWTYQMIPSDQPESIAWPSDAPQPNAIPIPGFATGEFPLPRNTELFTMVGGVPEWISTLSPIEIDSFYRTELFTLGWNVVGEGELLVASKEGTTFQLLITPDTATNGTRISILSGG